MIIASVWAVLFILASLLLGINLYTVRRPSRREESAFIYLTRRHFAMDGCGCFARLLRSSSSSTSSSSRRPRRRVPSRPPSHRARRRVPIPPRGAADHDARGLIPGPRQPARLRDAAQQAPRARGAFYTLVPIRPRRRGERRSLRTLPGVSLRPPLAFNPRPRRLSTPTDAFQLHPAIALYGTTLKFIIHGAVVLLGALCGCVSLTLLNAPIAYYHYAQYARARDARDGRDDGVRDVGRGTAAEDGQVRALRRGVRGSRLHLITLVPVRPRRRGERRSLKDFFTSRRVSPPNTPRFQSRHTSTPFNSNASDAFRLRPDVRSRGTTLISLLRTLYLGTHHAVHTFMTEEERTKAAEFMREAMLHQHHYHY